MMSSFWEPVSPAFYMVVALLGPAPLLQGGGQVALLGCEHATRAKVRAQWPGADSVRFAPAPTVSQINKWLFQITGSGQFWSKPPGEPRGFSYHCDFNTRSGATRVKVDLQREEGGRESRRRMAARSRSGRNTDTG